MKVSVKELTATTLVEKALRKASRVDILPAATEKS